MRFNWKSKQATVTPEQQEAANAALQDFVATYETARYEILKSADPLAYGPRSDSLDKARFLLIEQDREFGPGHFIKDRQTGKAVV